LSGLQSTAPHASLGSRLAWFVGLWAASVGLTFGAAQLLRWFFSHLLT
jgi:hypothetical protein